MERDGLVYVNRVLRAETVQIEEDLATQLNIEAGSRVHLLQRVRMIRQLPVGVETAYLPTSYFPDLLTHDFSEASLYHTLEQVEGICLTRAEQEISARRATPEECAHLRLADLAAILTLERRTYDNRARIVEYVQGVYNPQRYTIVTTIRR
jgi:GntR family transcriptional regulator